MQMNFGMNHSIKKDSLNRFISIKQFKLFSELIRYSDYTNESWKSNH